MLVTVFRRRILRVAVHGSHSGTPPDIRGAGGCSQLAGIQTDGHALEARAAVEGLGGQAIMDGLHDHFPQSCGGISVVAGQVDLLRLVVAAPDGGGVIARVAAEPAVPVAGCGTGLARDVLSREDGRTAGAVVGRVIQAVVHILHGLLPQNLAVVLGIVQNDLAIGVVDLCIGSGLPVDAVVGEGGIGRAHLPHGRTHCQRAQSQRGYAHVGQTLAVGQGVAAGQGILAEVVFCEAVAIVRADSR